MLLLCRKRENCIFKLGNKTEYHEIDVRSLRFNETIC